MFYDNSLFQGMTQFPKRDFSKFDPLFYSVTYFFLNVTIFYSSTTLYSVRIFRSIANFYRATHFLKCIPYFTV